MCFILFNFYLKYFMQMFNIRQGFIGGRYPVLISKKPNYGLIPLRFGVNGKKLDFMFTLLGYFA